MSHAAIFIKEFEKKLSLRGNTDQNEVETSIKWTRRNKEE
jgi:hypothetical protein